MPRRGDMNCCEIHLLYYDFFQGERKHLALMFKFFYRLMIDLCETRILLLTYASLEIISI